MAGKVVKIGGCEVFPCKCQHAFQDKRYGPGRRVHNMCKLKSGGTGYRCTVCSNVREGYQPQVVVPSEKEKVKDAG